MRHATTKKIAVMALLVALQIVLSRFLSFNTFNLKIGIAFVPVMIAAYLYGPLGGMAVSAVGDIIGAIAFPIGAYFPGFTATAALTGLVYGIALKKKESLLPRVIAAVAFNQLVCSLLINSAWITLLYGSQFKAMVISRLPQVALELIIQPLFAYFFFQKTKSLDRLKFKSK